jgi:hypothetical protein
MVRREKMFCTDIVNEMNLEQFAFKIPDQIFNPAARFNPRKAIDIMACLDGTFVAIEAKMIKVKKVKPESLLKPLRDDQRVCLGRVIKAKGFAFVVGKRFIPRKSEYYLVYFGMPSNMASADIFYSVPDLIKGVKEFIQRFKTT